MITILAVFNRFPTVRCIASAFLQVVAATLPLHAANLCAAPAELIGTLSPMPHVGATLKPGGTLDILTIGSATVFNPSESILPGTVTGQALGLGSIPARDPAPVPTDTAFPFQMAADLRQAFPGVTVNMTVKGGRGMLASEMLDILRTELQAHHYQLVVWQTGTVEAVRNVPAGDFYQTLSDGAALIADSGADLMLVDPQYSRFLHANADLTAYMQALEQIGAQPGVILFHRFNLMQDWATDGQIDLERTPKSERLKTVETLHACLGSSMAQMVIASAKMPPS